ncbi:SNARE associated protein [Schizosaccharomyces cryophilus OY26]|uniref:Golgi apparatus membrane protein TVP38 n=1 Tax=Schizosaccharomyces cryophilus (strain OY26 / ATCC MYA-4695 / CBS 11777 / NBRC 106824 / NRRL Y48691) TaxID=653667 RepID=S9X6Z0_SCHCR|nr:SNARE associated protein [Schizosaccharomyces cryophilus OY26]EPY49546.1 SNARE associated protein [Schizosaccharomyces cryophilus OY26]
MFQSRAMPKVIGLFALSIFLITSLVLLSVYHKEILHIILPIARNLSHHRFSFLIPLCMIAASSVPPLAGQDPISIVVGAVWGLNVGFCTVVCGIFLGESIAFLGYRYFLEEKAQEFRSRHQEHYGTFVKILEEGSYPLIWLIRLSFLPTHFTTVFFATIPQVSYVGWSIAFWFSCFKYLVPVYAGVCLAANTSTPANVIGIVLSGVITVGTFLLIVYRYQKLKEYQPPIARPASRSTELNALESQQSESEQNEYTYEYDRAARERDHLLSSKFA